MMWRKPQPNHALRHQMTPRRAGFAEMRQSRMSMVRPHSVHERTKLWRRDGDNVSRLVGESRTGDVEAPEKEGQYIAKIDPDPGRSRKGATADQP